MVCITDIHRAQALLLTVFRRYLYDAWANP